MPDSSLFSRQGSLLHDLIRISAQRAEAETSTKAGYAADTEAEAKHYKETRGAISRQFEQESAGEEERYQNTRKQIVTAYETGKAATEKNYQTARRSILGRYQKEKEAAQKDRDDTRWEATTVFDASKEGARKRFEQVKLKLASLRESFQPIRDDATRLLASYRKYVRPGQGEAGPTPEQPDGDPLASLQEAIERADAQLVRLEKRFFPRLVRWKNYVWLLLPLLAAFIAPAWWLLGMTAGLAGGAAVAIVAWVALRFWFVALARSQVSRDYPALSQAIADVESCSRRTEEWATSMQARQLAESEQKRDESLKRSEVNFTRRMEEAEKKRAEGLSRLEDDHNRRRAEIQDRHDTDLRALEENHARRAADIRQRFDEQTRELEEKHKFQVYATKSSFERAWNKVVENWRTGLEQVQAVVDETKLEGDRLFYDWTDPARVWTPSNEIPSGIKFGAYHIGMRQIPQGVPVDPQLQAVTPKSITFPACIPFPRVGSVLLKAFGAGREQAVQALQAVMLRYLTSLPPGKVRFTIIDPVGLGQNFSAFMHLADYDEAFVTSRIWTEPQQIEQRLTDLTDHMENVIQKYLRNEFETIEEYNAQAGEVAEPFRFLVIANLPVNFSDPTMRRLISIATSGARCGVYTLVSVDMKQPLPHGLTLKDLEAHSVNLVWKDDRFVWRGSDFESYPLEIDTPPPPSQLNALLQDVGAKAKDANRVEVPFEVIAPPADQWWTSDSSNGIDVPLGRAGATRLQHLKLGKGTSQHVLIAGRTGSGKSTLLHALITNLALHYSPDEVELYLIDFKKGVEFKTYATHELPHARVVAIESEREFGLSVLQRLDAELKYRGDKFRDVGAQDLNAYRQANGNAPTPRILLIVDEFQEFFVEDDKVAQEASLLLDRLVRQGRAFGIHVHLGSQTLSGAYSLARSTLGQMAVRIALQCSETDAHLILSEENAAARLLSRPGEAIYNDANGLVEGNHPFQVVWLADDRREIYLEQLQELARQRHVSPPPQIVFEGNRPADASKNPLLTQAISAPEWPPVPRSAQAWLGEAIAIKDPTSAVFRPQSGSNLLMIGQQDDAALGMFCTAVIGIAAQYPPAASADQAAGARFYILDGTPVDSPRAGFLDQLTSVVPHPAQMVGWRELPDVIADVAAEVERRQAAAGSEAQAIFLMIYDLQRFRDLRKAEDDFSFGRMGGEEKPSPSKQFANIVREGPLVGVYTIGWCDSLNNVNRTLDRQTLREFEMRVLFQMSANDSSTLIDSPVANKLGPNRALFFSEEQGRLEKFRPYGVPPIEWLQQVRDHFRRRTLPAGERQSVGSTVPGSQPGSEPRVSP